MLTLHDFPCKCSYGVANKRSFMVSNIQNCRLSHQCVGNESDRENCEVFPEFIYNSVCVFMYKEVPKMNL
jgi:hypothetical protein